MWGSHHRKMVCHANRGDGGHEEWQDAIPPLPMDVPPRATRHAVQPVWSRISRQVDRSPSAAFFMGAFCACKSGGYAACKAGAAHLKRVKGKNKKPATS
jgi:hypothetical protein